MKKSVTLLSLLALCAGFSTVAAAEGVFVGGSLDLQHAKFKNTLCSADENCSNSDGRLGVGLKAGYDFNQFRIYGAYQYNPKAKTKDTYTVGYPPVTLTDEGSWQSHDLTVGADYTPSFTDNFKGLVGGYVGYSRMQVKTKDQYVGFGGQVIDEHDSTSTNGFVYGVRLGGIYSFNEHNELEFGLKAEQAKYKAVTHDDWDFKGKATNYGAFVGYNYKF